MSQQAHSADPPDLSRLVTEDDTPVDNLFSEKQARLLADVLYATYRGPAGDGRFLAASDVGVFAKPENPAIVPDFFVAVDVTPPEELFEKRHRSYFLWEYGKPPEVVVEIVSNREGGELSTKVRSYERLRVSFYVVFDPEGHLSRSELTVFQIVGDALTETESHSLGRLGLSVTIWEGEYEAHRGRWLRFSDAHGTLLPTGLELAAAERQRADGERQRADGERQRADGERDRADGERERAERLLDKLRAAGLEE